MSTEASSGLTGLPSSEHDRLGKTDFVDSRYLSKQLSPTTQSGSPSGQFQHEPYNSRAVVAAQRTYQGLAGALSTTTANTDAVSRVWHQVRNQVQSTLADQVTPLRLAGHFSVLMIAAVILVLSQVQIPEWELSLQPTPAPSEGFGAAASLATAAGDANAFTDSASLRPNIVLTLIDRKVQQEAPRQETTYYTVKAGDTVLGIATKVGLEPETLMWSNSFIEQNPDSLSIGDVIRVLPVNGVLHVVKPGDTLSSIAEKYDVTMADIVGFSGNGIESISAPISIGKEIVVPGGTKPFAAGAVGTQSAFMVDTPSGAPKGSGNFSWPTPGYVSQGYWGGHPAYDIAGWIGSPVTAADGGYVVLAGGGWNGGYGNHVIIDHGNGFTTLYAHLNSVFISPGMTVSKGQQVGTMGSTGNSTGPHLHFEIRYGGVPYNPGSYLK